MSSTTVALVCGTITALMAAYGIGRHMRLTHLPLIVKCAIPAVFAILGFLHFVLLHVDAGFSRAFVIDTIPITALFVSMIYWFFILTIISDVVLFIRWGIAKAQGQTLPTRSVFTIILSSIVGVMSFVFGLTSAWSALSEPEQEVITVEVKNLPKALENLKVVQLSDLHASNLSRRHVPKAWLQQLTHFNPTSYSSLVTLPTERSIHLAATQVEKKTLRP